MARPVAAELLSGGSDSQRLQIGAVAPQPRSHQLLIGKHTFFIHSVSALCPRLRLPSFLWQDSLTLTAHLTGLVSEFRFH